MLNWETSYSETHFTKETDINKVKPLDDSDSVIYLIEPLEHEKEKFEISNTDIVLEIDQRFNNNFREALPSFGVVRKVLGCNPDFKVGDLVSCTHTAFVGTDRIARPFMKDKNGKEIYVVPQKKIKCSLFEKGGIKKPRTNIVICTPFKGKLINTSDILLVPETEIDNRRDIAKVLKVWEGCDLDINEKTDYLLLDEGGDYIFTWKKIDYIAVDFDMDGALAITDSPNWQNFEAKRHMKDHNDTGFN